MNMQISIPEDFYYFVNEDIVSSPFAAPVFQINYNSFNIHMELHLDEITTYTYVLYCNEKNEHEFVVNKQECPQFFHDLYESVYKDELKSGKFKCQYSDMNIFISKLTNDTTFITNLLKFIKKSIIQEL